MPKSVSLSLAISLLGTLLFAYRNWDPSQPLPEQTYISVALALFNASAITSLFVILYRSEREPAERFGAVMRDNIATIIVALLINLISTLVEIFGYFSR